MASGDTANFTETYDTKNVGTGKTLTATGTVNDGNGGNNYAVTFVTDTTRCDHGSGHHGDGGDQHQRLRRHHQRGSDADHHGGHAGTGDTANFTETYDTKNVGTGKTLTASGTVNDGNGGNNYAVTFVTDTTRRHHGSGHHGDGGHQHQGLRRHHQRRGGPPTITGTVASGDTANFIETYDNKNVGTGKTLTASGTVNDGNGGNNYAVTFVADTTGAITARAITVTAATNTKSYDGTTSAAAMPTITRARWPLATRANFTETYDNKNVGTGKTLTAAGSVNDGNGGNNYAVTFVTDTTRRDHGAGHYGDGGDQHQGLRRHHECRGDADHHGARWPLATPPTSRRPYDTKNAGTGKTLTASGAVNDGNGGNNYAVTFVADTTGAITARAITVTAATNTKDL